MVRSRRGCATCKKRRRKCDETRPHCMACQAQNMPCEGYGLVLRWGNGIASRGRFAKAVAPVENSPKLMPPQPSQFGASSSAKLIHTHSAIELCNASDSTILNQRSGDSDEISAEIHKQDSDKRRIHVQTAPTFGVFLGDENTAEANSADPKSFHATSRSNWNTQEGQDCLLLKEFFETTISQLYSTHEDDGLKLYLWQLSQGSDALAAILIALHLYLADPGTLSELFEEYYTRGLRLFRQQLEWDNDVPKAYMICAGVFICTLNVFQGIPWTIHLDHMLRLYHLGPGDYIDRPMLDEGAKEAVEWMAMMDLPTFVQGRPTSSLGLWNYHRRPSAPDRRDGIETISGLPRNLLDIFAYIDTEAAENAFSSWPGEVGEIPQCHLWESYRIAGILMGRRWRRAKARRDSNFKSLPTNLNTEVLLAKLIASLDALCDASIRPEYRHCLAINSSLYPYTAARLEVAILEKHKDWIKALDRIADVGKPYGKTKNARLVHEMLEEALQSGDDAYDIDEQAKRRGVEISLY